MAKLLLLINFLFSLQLVAMNNFEMPRKFLCYDEEDIISIRYANFLGNKIRLSASFRDRAYFFLEEQEFCIKNTYDKIILTAITGFNKIYLVILKNTYTQDGFSAEFHEESPSVPVKITKVSCVEYH